MTVPIYQVDAFAVERFKGNPAAVCPLKEWLPDDVMQKIAVENNLAETAFFVEEGDCFQLRWFTPTFEIDLCGHATLASAHVLLEHLGFSQKRIVFKSMSGELVVEQKGGLLEMDFPARAPEDSSIHDIFLNAFSIYPQKTMKSSRDDLWIFQSEQEIRSLKVAASLLKADQFNKGGIICTAPGDEVDFVSRFFMPGSSLFEDPVTGSAHCTLIPYWAKQLGKNNMVARQLSQRTGELHCTYHNDRVKIAGHAVTYLKGEIFL